MTRMRSWIPALAGILAVATAADAADKVSEARHALLVGIDHYAPAYGPSSLDGCINDAKGMQGTLLGDTTRWPAELMTVKTDAAATKSAIRGYLGWLAGVASNERVLYYHSSHGGQHSGTSTYLCMHDANYEDYELAADLAKFAAGVEVFVIVDACHSAGLFKKSAGDGGRWNFAENVMRHLEGARKAMGETKGPSVGWITACDYDEACQAGNPNSVFTKHLIEGLYSGDTNVDGLVSFLEAFDYAAPRAIAESPGQDACRHNAALLSGTTATKSLDGSVSNAVEYPGPWTIAGGGWSGRRVITHDGADAAQSGVTTNDGNAWMEATVNGPATLTFWWKVSSEANYDILAFSIDGWPGVYITGECPWAPKRYDLNSGPHTLRWTYAKDASLAVGADCGWVDQVRILPAGIGTAANDFDGDGASDMALSRAISGRVWNRDSYDGTVYASSVGQASWLATPADYDGDGFADYSWFIPATTAWRIYESSQGFAERLPRVRIGGANDTPAPADFDGDGKADIAVFCAGSGKIWVRHSTRNYTNLMISAAGMPTWLPTPGDYDGDGKADFSWFIPATQVWRMYWSTSNYAERLPRLTIGEADDVPIPAMDFDGDGKADPAVFQHLSGRITFLESALDYEWGKVSMVGNPTWLPTVADYDGDGKADFSWFIPATRVWRVYESSNYDEERFPRVKIGASSDWPLATPLLGW